MKKASENNDANAEKGNGKAKKVKVPCVTIPFFVCRKGREERLSGEQLLVYGWIYGHNLKAGKDMVYGKHTYMQLQAEVAADLGLVAVDKLCLKLEKVGWLRKTHAKAYRGKRMVGYHCMLDPHQAAASREGEQMELMQLEAVAEEVPTMVASDALGDADNGERYQFGERFYYDEQGVMVKVPMGAPARPSKTAIWSSDPEGWFEPEEVPEHDLEY